MTATLRHLIAPVLVLAVVTSLGPRVSDLGHVRLVADTKTAFEQGDTMAFRVAGRLPRESPEPSRSVFNGDLMSLATGDTVGSFTWDLTCHHAVGVPCIVYEVTNTFRLPQGSLVARTHATAAPDAGHPGYFLIGVHPDANNIVEATGAFAGRSGRAHQSGRHDGRDLPGFVTFDDFWLIELDPKG